MMLRCLIVCLVAILLNSTGVESEIFSNVFKSRMSTSRAPKKLDIASILDSSSSSKLAVSNITAGELQSAVEKILRVTNTESYSLGKIEVQDSVVTITPRKALWKRKSSYVFHSSAKHKASNRESRHGSGIVTLKGQHALKSAIWKRKPTAVEIVVKYSLSPKTLSIDYALTSEEGSTVDHNAAFVIWRAFLQSALRTELGHVAARKNLVTSYRVDAESRAMSIKKRQLDEIIHPEKYRSKRSGSRMNTKVVGSGGRYRPSATTQARRQVRGK